MFSLFSKQNHSEATRTRIVGAFPSGLTSDVEAVLNAIPVAKHEPSKSDIGVITVEGECLHIPSRIYFPEPAQEFLSELSKQQRVILACLYTRHHDGFVREKWLKQIINAEEKWTVPFVLQFTGEYIIEIIKFLSDNVESLKREHYSNFIKANSDFTIKTSQRILSYWECYFRGVSPVFINYCGYKTANEIGLWNCKVASRLIKSQQQRVGK
jgi:hypothetical protein